MLSLWPPSEDKDVLQPFALFNFCSIHDINERKLLYLSLVSLTNPTSLSPDGGPVIHNTGDDVITEKLVWMIPFSSQVVI